MKCIIAIACMAFTLAASAADKGAVSNAQSSAKSWLALVDGGKFEASWDSAAAFFRSAITKADWERTVTSVRAPLGVLKSRTLKSATPTRVLPSAPDGEYVVIQFESRFENKASAIEIVTPMREKDGSWKVSGYYIK